MTQPSLTPAQIHLALTAERLFAQRGIDGVSLREIAQEAGARNNNAVQYHFATRDGLMAAIYAHRVAQMEPLRAAMMEHGPALDSLELMQVLCLPHLALAAPDGSHPYAGFLVHYMMRHWRAPGDDLPLGQGAVMPVQGQVVAALAQCLGDVAPGIKRMRIMLALQVFLNALLRRDHLAGQLDLTDALRSAHAVLRLGGSEAPLRFADRIP